jgi:hypothetical protein
MSDKKDYKFSDYSIAELKKICNDFKSQHTLRNIGDLSKSELVSAMEKIFYFTEGKLYLRNSHERKLPLPERQRNQAKIGKYSLSTQITNTGDVQSLKFLYHPGV